MSGPCYARPTAATLSKVRATTPRSRTGLGTPSPRSRGNSSQRELECEADLVRSALPYKQTTNAVASRGSGGVYAELRNAARHHTPRQHTPDQTTPQTTIKTPRPSTSKVGSPRQRQREQSRADRAVAEQERWRRVLGEHGSRQQHSKSSERAPDERRERSKTPRTDRGNQRDRPLSDRGDRTFKADKDRTEKADRSRAKTTPPNGRTRSSPRVAEHHTRITHTSKFSGDSEDYDSAVTDSSSIFPLSTATETDTEATNATRDPKIPTPDTRRAGGVSSSSGYYGWGGRQPSNGKGSVVPRLWEKGATPTGTPKITPRRKASNDEETGGHVSQWENMKRELRMAENMGPAEMYGEKPTSSGPKKPALERRPTEVLQSALSKAAQVERASAEFVAYLDKSDSDTPFTQPLRSTVERAGENDRDRNAGDLAAQRYLPAAADLSHDSEADEGALSRLSHERNLSMSEPPSSGASIIQSLSSHSSPSLLPVASNVLGHPSGSNHKMSSTPNVSPFAWASAVRNELQKVRGQVSGGTGFEGWANQGTSSDKWRQEKIRSDHLDYNALAREKLALQLLMRERQEQEMRQHLKSLMSAGSEAASNTLAQSPP